MFQARADGATGAAIVVADGDVPSRAELDAAWPGWYPDDALVVAADGGWYKALALGLSPSVLVGDGDSLPAIAFAEAQAAGVETNRVAAAKDESDTELALRAALARGASRVVILGALGGRLDHALANLGLLALPAPREAAVELLDGRTRVRLLRASGEEVSLPLPGATGDVVSLLPFGITAEGVTTRGLEYPLRDEPLPPGPARGLSNVRIDPGASVSLRSGQLLVVETRASQGGTA